jgi:hypothetical protein
MLKKHPESHPKKHTESHQICAHFQTHFGIPKMYRMLKLDGFRYVFSYAENQPNSNRFVTVRPVDLAGPG